jgi:hypothetical protein
VPTIGSAPVPATQALTTPPAAAPNPPINPGLPAADNIRSQ